MVAESTLVSCFLGGHDLLALLSLESGGQRRSGSPSHTQGPRLPSHSMARENLKYEKGGWNKYLSFHHPNKWCLYLLPGIFIKEKLLRMISNVKSPLFHPTCCLFPLSSPSREQE